jgi:hypothetical protein
MDIHLGTKKAFGKWVLIIAGTIVQIITIKKREWDELKKSGLIVEG